jgi:hypothetical protein
MGTFEEDLSAEFEASPPAPPPPPPPNNTAAESFRIAIGSNDPGQRANDQVTIQRGMRSGTVQVPVSSHPPHHAKTSRLGLGFPT